RQGASALLYGSTLHVPQVRDIAVVVATVGINAYVVWYESRRGRQLNSALLMADAAHTRSDILVTVIAIASLYLANRGIHRVDGALAIVVGLVIAWTGYQILRMSIPVLVDERAL